MMDLDFFPLVEKIPSVLVTRLFGNYDLSLTSIMTYQRRFSHTEMFPLTYYQLYYRDDTFYLQRVRGVMITDNSKQILRQILLEL